MLQRVLGTALGVVLCNAVGIAGALFTSTQTDWYRQLVKPSFQPPGWIFGPMWTLLYTLMGIALYRLYARRNQDGARAALWLFGAQLLLNGVWSPIFFGAQALGAALAVIVALVAVLALTTKRAFAIDRAAGWLLVPYLGWVSFATVLNAAILRLN
ncbi:MAG: tryptophan-rich sensory protein [Deltaproteobacteria bacterium]|jgi:tryptophan-rich sensory protein|nr:tryptophan-rich sensory protein [Deltaproteobacteria bacterium]MBW2530894.1 tryptophan-rich sensory protein [Deltaproteobacteria bacterium]